MWRTLRPARWSSNKACVNESAYEPDSVPRRSFRKAPGGDHPSRSAIADSLKQHTREYRTGSPQTLAHAHDEACAILPCSWWGLPSRCNHLPRWCALTAPFHPHRISTALRQRHRLCARRSIFCGTIPAGHPGLLLATTMPSGVRTFLDSGLDTLCKKRRPVPLTAAITRPARSNG